MQRGAPQAERMLIERYRQGDEEALRTLFETHGEALWGWIQARVPGRLAHRISVSDLLQELQIVAYRRREDFDPDGPASFRTWLIGIAKKKLGESVRFHVGTAKRAAARELSQGRRADTAQFASAWATPSQHAIAHETARLAREALGTLSQDDRDVLRLTREQQLPLREVAARMGRSYAATRKLYARALSRFRAAFERLENDG